MLRTKPAKAMEWRLFVATLVLMAFAFQSYLTQTHIHVLLPAFAVSKTAAPGHTARTGIEGAAGQHAPNKAPGNDDPMKCPLCQAVGYAGHFVTPPAAASLLLPTVAISVLLLTVAILSPRQIPSHSWQGRGPPNS